VVTLQRPCSDSNRKVTDIKWKAVANRCEISGDGVSRPVFWSLGLEDLRSRLGGLCLEGFRSRSGDIRLETLHRLFFYEVLQEGVP